MNPRRLLVIQLARMGDLVQTWPLLTRLRRLWPDCRLTLLCDASLLPLASLGPAGLHPQGLDLAGLAMVAKESHLRAGRALRVQLAAIKGAGAEMVLNLNFSRFSLLLANFLGTTVEGYAPLKGGREFGRNAWLAYIFALAHARTLNRVHLSDVFRHLVPAPPSEEAPRASPRAALEPLIALQLGTRHPRRTWPREAFAALARRLVGHLGARLLLVGTAAERPAGEWLCHSLAIRHRERVINLMGKTTLPDLAEQLQQASLLVSGDTGTLHLAAALGVPTLALFFGPAQCFETGPYGLGHLVLQAEPPCHPCRESSSCEEPVCSRMISPQVAAQVVEGMLLGEVRTVTPWPGGVRLYESARDWLGNTYVIRQGPPPGLPHIIGEAYRRAAAPLLALPLPPLPRPDIPPTLRAMLAHWAESVQSQRWEEAPNAVEALAPLAAFHAEAGRQAAWQGREDRWRFWLAQVHAAFVHHLAQWGA